MRDLHSTAIKICGLQTEEAVLAAVNHGATHIGFVFANSRRQVSMDIAANLSKLANGVRIVGVFVDPTLEELQEVLAKVPLAVIQLHGAETIEFCREVSKLCGEQVQIWKALSAGESIAEEIRMYCAEVDAILIDTYHPGMRGGSGKTFSWEILPELEKLLESIGVQTPIWVAGGLNPDNVGSLLNSYRVYGVDVSSGVEVDSVKSPERIRKFIEEVTQNHGISR